MRRAWLAVAAVFLGITTAHASDGIIVPDPQGCSGQTSGTYQNADNSTGCQPGYAQVTFDHNNPTGGADAQVCDGAQGAPLGPGYAYVDTAGHGGAGSNSDLGNGFAGHNDNQHQQDGSGAYCGGPYQCQATDGPTCQSSSGVSPSVPPVPTVPASGPVCESASPQGNPVTACLTTPPGTQVCVMLGNGQPPQGDTICDPPPGVLPAPLTQPLLPGPAPSRAGPSNLAGGAPARVADHTIKG
ncbi:MAG: hypothetical protein ACYDAY_11890 [Candidatus Dormibacteria bacterium]